MKLLKRISVVLTIFIIVIGLNLIVELIKPDCTLLTSVMS